jgi:hypothetical protein
MSYLYLSVRRIIIMDQTLAREDASEKPRDHVILCIVIYPIQALLSFFQSWLLYNISNCLLALHRLTSGTKLDTFSTSGLDFLSTIPE